MGVHLAEDLHFAKRFVLYISIYESRMVFMYCVYIYIYLYFIYFILLIYICIYFIVCSCVWFLNICESWSYLQNGFMCSLFFTQSRASQLAWDHRLSGCEGGWQFSQLLLVFSLYSVSKARGISIHCGSKVCQSQTHLFQSKQLSQTCAIYV